MIHCQVCNRITPDLAKLRQDGSVKPVICEKCRRKTEKPLAIGWAYGDNERVRKAHEDTQH